MAFKFLHRVITDFADATRNFEQLEQTAAPNGTSPWLPWLTAQSGQWTVGRANLVFPNAQNATQLTFSTGLSRTVQRAYFQLVAGVFNANLTVGYLASGTDSIQLNGFSSIVINTTLSLDWLAFG